MGRGDRWGTGRFVGSGVVVGTLVGVSVGGMRVGRRVAVAVNVAVAVAVAVGVGVSVLVAVAVAVAVALAVAVSVAVSVAVGVAVVGLEPGIERSWPAIELFSRLVMMKPAVRATSAISMTATGTRHDRRLIEADRTGEAIEAEVDTAFNSAAGGAATNTRSV